jgi:hypothetical protein
VYRTRRIKMKLSEAARDNNGAALRTLVLMIHNNIKHATDPTGANAASNGAIVDRGATGNGGPWPRHWYMREPPSTNDLSTI